MSRIPRLLPLVGVAIGGVLAVKAVTEAPQIWGGAQAFAEDMVHPGRAKSPLPPDASVLGDASANASNASAAHPAVCAPTAAELAKEAGLSPAELLVLQSLSNRRGELDQREMSLDTQVQLIAAAEAKLDSRIQDMNQLKSQIQGLLGQADQQQQADQQRLVRVYEDMDPKKAAAAMTVMADSVRVPIAAAMKERKLAAILQAMQPADAKALTELLAGRMAGSPVIANAKAALNGQPVPPAAGQPANGQAQTAQPAAPTDQAAAAQADKTGKAGKTAKTGKTDQTQASDQSASADDAKTRPAPKTHRGQHAKARPKQPPADSASSQAQAGKTTPATQSAQPAAASNASKAQPTASASKAQVAPAKVAPPVPPNAKIG